MKLDFKQYNKSPIIIDNTVIFYLEMPDIETVSVIGSFNNWEYHVEMEKKPDVSYFLSPPIKIFEKGINEYRYLINNSQYITDPKNFKTINDGYNTNSCFEAWIDPPGYKDYLQHFVKKIFSAYCSKDYIAHDALLSSLDALLMIDPVNRSTALRDVFESNLKTMVTNLNKSVDSDDIYVYHLYNAGYLLKTKQGIIGFDLVSTNYIWNLNWDITQKVIDNLIDKLDFLIVSHWHSDHCDEYIIRQMIRLNKKVFAPNADLSKYPAGVIGLEDNKKIILDGITLIPHAGIHVYDMERNISVMYFEIIVNNNTNILLTSDHDYTKKLDVANKYFRLIIPKFGGITPECNALESLQILLQTINTDFILPAHIMELSHPPGGGRFGYYKTFTELDGFYKPYRVLFWGEEIKL